jgi:hypothetical protein
MNVDINALVLIGQLVLTAVVVWLASRKAPVERQSLEASTAAQYAVAAKNKAEENERLESEIQSLTHRLEVVEKKKYRIIMEFTIGDPPEMGKVTIEPLIDIPPISTSMPKIGNPTSPKKGK